MGYTEGRKYANFKISKMFEEINLRIVILYFDSATFALFTLIEKAFITNKCLFLSLPTFV